MKKEEIGEMGEAGEIGEVGAYRHCEGFARSNPD